MPNKKKKILIIEDEEPMARALKLKLDASGFEAQVATDGRDGIQALKEDSFDLVVLDLVMPLIDGFQVLEEMQENNIKVPTIVLSNLSQPEDEQRAKELGALDYYLKAETSLSRLVEIINDSFVG